jgi:hypothetical protein
MAKMVMKTQQSCQFRHSESQGDTHLSGMMQVANKDAGEDKYLIVAHWGIL